MPHARVLPFSTSPRPPRFPHPLGLERLLEVGARLEPSALALIIDSASVMAKPKGGAR